MRVIELRYVWIACLLCFLSGSSFRHFVALIWTQDPRPSKYLLALAVCLAMGIAAYDYVRRRFRQLPR